MERPNAVRALLNKRYSMNDTLKRGAERIADYIIELEEEMRNLRRQIDAYRTKEETVNRTLRHIEVAHSAEQYIEGVIESTELDWRREPAAFGQKGLVEQKLIVKMYVTSMTNFTAPPGMGAIVRIVPTEKGRPRGEG